MKFEELDDEQKGFLVEIDGMIESTDEFIADDDLTPETDPEGRFIDRAALAYVRDLFCHWYGLVEEESPDRAERAQYAVDQFVSAAAFLRSELDEVGPLAIEQNWQVTQASPPLDLVTDNGRVQSWLTAWQAHNTSEGEREHDAVDHVIEIVQETYIYPPETGKEEQ
jgi:hypothetical protein